MIAKCQCQHCQQPIEFDAEHTGAFVECPGCAQKTRLLIPGAKRIEFSKPDPQNIKWGLSQWFTLALVVSIIAMFIYVVADRGAREFIAANIGTWIGTLFILALIGGLVGLAWLLITSGIMMTSIIFTIGAVGLYLCVDGIFTMQRVSDSSEATIFQEIYATVEFAGGALVFCGAMILKLVREMALQMKENAAKNA